MLDLFKALRGPGASVRACTPLTLSDRPTITCSPPREAPHTHTKSEPSPPHPSSDSEPDLPMTRLLHSTSLEGVQAAIQEMRDVLNGCAQFSPRCLLTREAETTF